MSLRMSYSLRSKLQLWLMAMWTLLLGPLIPMLPH